MGMYNLHQDSFALACGMLFGCMQQMTVEMANLQLCAARFCTEIKDHRTLTGWKSRCQKCANSDQNCSPQGVKATIVREGAREAKCMGHAVGNEMMEQGFEERALA